MIKYKIQFTNDVGEDYLIVFDQKSYSGDPSFIKGTGDVLTIRSLNNDDDRFSPILSKECVIRMWITAGEAITINDFTATEDDEWRIMVYRDQSQPPVFDGYLLVEDSSQPLYDKPFDLTIRASDGLPLLHNVELKKSDGEDFDDLNSLADYVGHILYYVNPNIKFRIYYDIFHVDMNLTEDPFAQIQVDAKTFENEETTFVDAYRALEIILLDTGCRLFYENGYWHIVSVWQHHNTTGYNFTEYEIVTDLRSKTGEVSNEIYQSEIGKGKPIKFINKDAVIYFKVASKSVKKTFRYEIPKEIIVNQQLLRGAEIPGLSTPTSDAFELDGWEQIVYGTGFTGPAMAVKTAYIKRDFDTFDYEKDRYIVLPSNGSFAGSAILRTSRFYVGQSDKVTFSVETRLKNDYNGNQVSLVFRVMLWGDDGTNWTLNNSGVWVQSNTAFTTNLQAITYSYTSADDDKTKWRTASVSSDPTPTTGEIHLIFQEQSYDAYPNETWYKNLQVTYEPYIKDSYRPADGDYNLYSQDLKINKAIDEQVSISDSPKKIIKGAIFVNNDLATPEWFRLGYTESLRFTQIQTLIKYNYNYRQFQKVEGTLKGLSLYDASANNIPFGFLPQYLLSDAPVSVSRYMLTSMEINYATGHWRGVLVEVRTGQDQVFDKYEFQYLFS